MSKLIHVKDRMGEFYLFICPGCKMYHMIPVNYFPAYTHKEGKEKPTWAFNGDLDNPTFKPAFSVDWVGVEPPQKCHAIIRDGWLIYLVDTTHHLSGSRIKMVDTE